MTIHMKRLILLSANCNKMSCKCYKMYIMKLERLTIKSQV